MRLPLLLALSATALTAQQPRPAQATDSAVQARLRAERREDPRPATTRRDGEGPYPRLVIRGAMLVDGTGAPPRGPVDILVENNRITEIQNAGTPNVPLDSAALARRPRGDRVIDATGMFVTPGFVDMHVHQGTQQKAADSDYYNKLWLAHGITTVRGVPFASFLYSVTEKRRSARNEIAAPRYWVYQRPGTGWGRGPVRTPELAREWVRWAAQQGADGMKLGAERPAIMAALLDEARKLGLGSTAHLQQTGVANMNAHDAARLGLGSLTHFYGLFESMYDASDVQPWPAEMNYNDEMHRFGQVARQWSLVTPRGERWNALLKEFRERDLTLDPTLSIYSASRDLQRKMTAPWHQKYTLASLWAYYQPNRVNHGAYWYDWTSWDETAWRNYYRVWMQFLNDYKNLGGRVTTGTDAGFIYSTPGFAMPEEMEMLQEAGFHPLEVIRAATLHGAQTLAKPRGTEPDFGTVEPGMLADLAIVDGNPIANLKVLYGTGWPRLDDRTGRVDTVGGVRWTIKDGIVYDARALLADVARMVEEGRRTTRTATEGTR